MRPRDVKLPQAKLQGTKHTRRAARAAAISKGAKGRLLKAVALTLKFTREQGATRPQAVTWPSHFDVPPLSPRPAHISHFTLSPSTRTRATLSQRHWQGAGGGERGAGGILSSRLFLLVSTPAVWLLR